MLVWAVFGACPPSNSMFFRCFFGLVRRSVFFRDVSAGLLVFAPLQVPFLLSKVNIFGLVRKFSLCQHKKEPSRYFFAVLVAPLSPRAANWDHFGSLPERFAEGRISQSGLFFAFVASWQVSSVFGGCFLAKSYFLLSQIPSSAAWRLRFYSVCNGSQFLFILGCGLRSCSREASF